MRATGTGLRFKVRPRTKFTSLLPVTFHFQGYVDIKVKRIDPATLAEQASPVIVLSVSVFSDVYHLISTLLPCMSPQAPSSSDPMPSVHAGICSICLDRKTDLVLPCMVTSIQHAFCELCIEQWCIRDHSCPACRLLIRSLNSEGFLMVSQTEADTRRMLEEGLQELWTLLKQ